MEEVVVVPSGLSWNRRSNSRLARGRRRRPVRRSWSTSRSGSLWPRTWSGNKKKLNEFCVEDLSFASETKTLDNFKKAKNLLIVSINFPLMSQNLCFLASASVISVSRPKIIILILKSNYNKNKNNLNFCFTVLQVFFQQLHRRPPVWLRVLRSSSGRRRRCSRASSSCSGHTRVRKTSPVDKQWNFNSISIQLLQLILKVDLT